MDDHKMASGPAERMTSVRDQEWMKARRRHVIHVVRY